MPRVVVIGAGAAGTMAAVFAASSGAETLLLERTKDGGRKILISGGGRCNILPAAVDESRFVSDSPQHLVRRILRSWPLREQIDFFQHEAAIPLVEEPQSAKLFPASQSGKDVRDRLLELARRRGVTVLTDTRVTGLTPPAPQPPNQRWQVHRERSQAVVADAVVVATGGLSVPQTGSDGSGLRMAEALGHIVTPTYAALTPLTASPAPFATLSGISLPVTITATANGISATADGGFLFTHRGYSGPAVLDVSHVAVRSRETASPARIVVRWTRLDERAWTSILRAGTARSVNRVLSTEMPQRLAEALLEAADIDPRRALSNLSRQERHRLIQILLRSDLPWTGDEGYKKAEVTGGGVRLSEVDPKTMESRRHKGLFLCGEMLDAFGPIGGHNFLWAWATGRAAGLAAAAINA